MILSSCTAAAMFMNGLVQQLERCEFYSALRKYLLYSRNVANDTIDINLMQAECSRINVLVVV